MRIVGPLEPGYDKDRVICNARFDYRPWAIYYCENGSTATRWRTGLTSGLAGDFGEAGK